MGDPEAADPSGVTTTGPMICLASAHGSPGVTTTALLLAAAWPSGAGLVVEADPSGGVIAARHDLGTEPGLTALATAVRHGPVDVHIDDHAQRLPGGLRVVCAPPSPDQVAAALRRLGDARVCDWIATVATPVVVDCGRTLPGGPAEPLLRRADLVVWVCRSDLAELAVLRHRLTVLDGDHVVLVGEDPYDAAEVRRALAGPPVTALPHDPRAAGVVTAGLPRRRLRRSRLPAATSRLVESLSADLERRTIHGPGEPAERRRAEVVA